VTIIVGVREYEKTNVDGEWPESKKESSHNQATAGWGFGLSRRLSLDLRETQFEDFGYQKKLLIDTEQNLDQT